MKIGELNIRAFVVCLQELPEKEANIQRHFKEVGIEAEVFNGIHGTTSGLRTTFPYEIDAPGSGWNCGIKPVATWLSFYTMWCAMSYMPDEYFLTLEWDAKFPADWKSRTEQALRDVPKDFDYLMLGSCCCADVPKKHIKGDVWETKMAQCGHATIIAKKALPVLLRTQRRVYAPLDISLTLHTFQHLKVYVVLPRIAEQFDTVLPP